jgi:phosphoglycolate phosphatase-like HAD superfamily hydrolase
MINFDNQIAAKKAIVLGLDNVIFPEKDYLLQVYYLFSEFMAYTEQFSSSEIIAFMQSEFALNGADQIFEKTAVKFKIASKYKENFLLLHENARLPLKLLMYQQMLVFLQEVVVNRKEIILLIDGKPIEQLNKIKQLEWHGLEQYLKAYFTDEFSPKPSLEGIEFIMKKHDLTTTDIVMIGNTASDEIYAANVGIEYLSAKEII